MSSERTWSANFLPMSRPCSTSNSGISLPIPQMTIGRMIAIAQHHRRDIPLPPFVKVCAVIELDLVRLPGIEGLVEHQQAKPVAGVQKSGRRRIVRRSHRVIAGRLEQFHPALLGAIKRGGPQRAVVMMDAATCELDRLAVQQQTLSRPTTRVTGYRTASQSRSITVAIPAMRETARYSVGEAGDHRAGLATVIVCAASISFPGAIVKRDCAVPASCPALSYSVVSTVTSADFADSFATLVRIETCAASGETFGRGDEHSPVRHMRRIGYDDADMPVDP